MPSVLKIHETFTKAGTLTRVYLRVNPSGVDLVDDDGSHPLPEGAVEAVMSRFGKPLDGAAQLSTLASLRLSGGGVLHHCRHRARYDVIARDYLVYEALGRESCCALATTVSGALSHLARAARPPNG